MNFRGAKVNITGHVTKKQVYLAWLQLQQLKLRKQTYFSASGISIKSLPTGDIINIIGKEISKKEFKLEKKLPEYNDYEFLYLGFQELDTVNSTAILSQQYTTGYKLICGAGLYSSLFYTITNSFLESTVVYNELDSYTNYSEVTEAEYTVPGNPAGNWYGDGSVPLYTFYEYPTSYTYEDIYAGAKSPGITAIVYSTPDKEFETDDVVTLYISINGREIELITVTIGYWNPHIKGLKIFSYNKEEFCVLTIRYQSWHGSTPPSYTQSWVFNIAGVLLKTFTHYDYSGFVNDDWLEDDLGNAFFNGPKIYSTMRVR